MHSPDSPIREAETADKRLSVAEAAAALNGSEYGSEGSRELWASMKAAGLVAVYGASDDLMEFRGAIDDEVGACGGTTVFLTPQGLFEPCKSGCRYSEAAQADTVALTALWDPGDDLSWAYETAIPHSTFVVMEDGQPYCRGIVFALADACRSVTAASPKQAGYEAAGEVNKTPPLPAETEGRVKP